MNKMKFNIGDTVIYSGSVGKIVCATNKFGDYIYGVQIEGYSGHNCTFFKLCAGEYPTGHNSVWVRESNLRLLSKSHKYKVIITSDGKKTKAAKYVDGEIVAKGESSCDERYDKFSFNVGMTMAMDRMIKNEFNKNLFNGKAIALNIDGKLPKCITPNKIYQFKDGYPVGVNHFGISKRLVEAVTKDDMKNNTGWIKNLFFPVVE